MIEKVLYQFEKVRQLLEKIEFNTRKVHIKPTWTYEDTEVDDESSE